MKIFVDFDSVLFDLQAKAVEYAKKIYGIDLQYIDIDNWHFFKDYPEVLKVYYTWKLYKESPMFHGSVEFLNKLQDIFGKENVFILTHTHEDFIEEKNELIREKYNFDNVIHAEKKYLYTGDNILLDDHTVNIVEHIENNPNGIGLLFDKDGQYGWNKEPIEKQNSNIYRLHSYEEVLKFIHKL